RSSDLPVGRDDRTAVLGYHPRPGRSRMTGELDTLERQGAGRLAGSRVDLVVVVAWTTICVVLLFLGLPTERFFTIDNARGILASGGLVGTAALGLSLLVISGSFVSLALGVTASVGGMLMLGSVRAGLLVAIILALVACGVISALQGTLVGYLESN